LLPKQIKRILSSFPITVFKVEFYFFACLNARANYIRLLLH